MNGIEGDRSAAEVRLDPGDIEWWDYRSWARQMRQPVCVIALQVLMVSPEIPVGS